MDGSERMWFGVFFIAIGIIGLVFYVVKRRGAHAVLLSLAFVALGCAVLLKLFSLDSAFGAMVVLIGVRLLVDRIRTRSTKTIVVAVVCVVAGASVLARLLTYDNVFKVLVVAYVVWALVQGIRARAVGAILLYGGFAAIGLVSLSVIPTGLDTVEFVICMVAFLAFLAGIALDGWRIPPPANSQPPTDN